MMTHARRKALKDAILALEHHLMECNGAGCCSPHVQEEQRESLQILNEWLEETK